MKKVLLFFACTYCLIACNNQSPKEEKAPNVKIIHAEKLEASPERSYSFISQPYRTTELSFRVGGPIYTFEAQSGQFYRKGDLIAAIDDRDFQIRKQRAEALFKQAEADYRRISNLYEKGNISGTNYEKAKADYEKAQADFTTAANELKDTKLYALLSTDTFKMSILNVIRKSKLLIRLCHSLIYPKSKQKLTYQKIWP